MIILNTVNHENNKIEYHFSHDDFKGVVFKILANFDVIQEDDGEHYLTCNYENLNHNFNGLVVSEIDVKQACDEFSMAVLQSLLEQIKNNVNETVAEIENVGK